MKKQQDTRMTDKTDIKVRVTHRHSDIYMLGAIAHHQLEQAKREGDGHRFRWIIPCMAISVFRLEALSNQYGSQLFSQWDSWTRGKGSRSFKWRISRVSRQLGLAPDYSQEPWSTIACMIDFRNRLAHCKEVENSVEGTVTSLGELVGLRGEAFAVDKALANDSTLENAERFHVLVGDLEGMLRHQARVQQQQLDTTGGTRYEMVEHDEHGNASYQPTDWDMLVNHFMQG